MLDGLLQPTHLLLILPLTVAWFLVVWPFWRILVKAGYPGPVSLISILPFGSIGILVWLAFAQWPLERASKYQFKDFGAHR